MATYLAGVDIGTSGAKAMVFDLAGKPLASVYQEYPCSYPRPGWVEQDADHLVEATMDAMARAVVQSGLKRLLSTQNREQHFAPTANLMISKKKISRIYLTNSPEYGRLRHRSLLFRTRLIFVAYPGGAGHEGIRFQRTYKSLLRKWRAQAAPGDCTDHRQKSDAMARYAIMVTNNENYLILLKIGGLSRFNFN